MTRRKFLVVTLLAAFAVSALTPITFGLVGMLVYGSSRWLVEFLFGPFGPDEFFVQGYAMGLIWPWLVAAVVILMRQLQAGRGYSSTVRGGLYAAVIYLATLILAVAVSAG